mmetsp:Transcript_8650/g.25679  ORF Transcript_8650/g.25679 Transcript_8650/m.25679 type:complete len:343 (+) Transcript_8650:592-1620(+)
MHIDNRLHAGGNRLDGMLWRLESCARLRARRSDPGAGSLGRLQAGLARGVRAHRRRGRGRLGRERRLARASVGRRARGLGDVPLHRRRRVQALWRHPRPRDQAVRSRRRARQRARGRRRPLHHRRVRRGVGVHRLAGGLRDRGVRAGVSGRGVRQARARGGRAVEAGGGQLPRRHHRDRRAAALHLWLCHRRRAAGAGPRRRGLLLHQPRRAGDLQVWARARDRDEAKVTRGGPGGGEQPRLDARQPRRGRRVGLRQEAALGRVSRRRRLWSRALGQLPFPRRLGGWHRGGVRTVGVVRLGVAGGRSRLHEPSLSKNNALDVHVARFRRSHAAVLSCVICDL